VAISLGFLALIGCTEGAKAGDLTARARSYMDLRQKGSWDVIWSGLVDPEAREAIKRGAFMARRRSSFDILGFEIVSVDDEGRTGRVVARMETEVPVLKPGGGTMRIPRELEDTQEWVRREGRWYIRLQG